MKLPDNLERVFKMDTLRLTKNNLENAAALIQAGEIVAFPTDTVYGLGADATNEDAVRKIFKAKGRPADRPLSVLVNHPDALEQFGKDIPVGAKKLAEKFWPGPLTIIVKDANIFAPSVTAGKRTVGLRMPNNPIVLQFINQAGVPLATPSANSTGRPSPTLAEHVLGDLDGKISAVIDGGETAYGIESTVLDYSDTEHPVLLRSGNISKETIESIINREVYLPNKQPKTNQKNSKTHSDKHYEPMIPVYAVHSPWDQALKTMTEKEEKIGLLANEEIISKFEEDVEATFSLGKANDISSANRQFFNGLRTLEKSGATVILVETFKENELSIPYMNRLQEAANKKSI